MTTQDLTIKLKLKDEATKGMGKASGGIKRNAGKITGNLKAVGAVGSVALGGIGLAALALGDEFKDAENIIASGTGALGKDLEGLKDDFKDVFVDVPDDAATVAQAIADINTEFGFTGDKLQEVSELALIAGRSMNEDMGGLIKATADTLIQFGEPVEKAEEWLDKLTVASQGSGTSMFKLTDQTKKFAPTLQAMGLGMDESLALITNMESQGFKTAKMMPGLNTAMDLLAKEGVTDIAEGLADAIKEIELAETDTEKLTKSMDLFGATGGPMFKEAIDKGVFSLDEMLAAMATSEGTLKNLGESTLTSSEKFDIFKNKVKGVLEPVGGFAAAAGPMLMIIPGITSAVTLLSGATWIQTGAMAALNIAMGPIGLIILGIVAAVAVIILIWKNWDTIVEAFKKTLAALKPVFDTVKDGITDALTSLKSKWDIIWFGMRSTFDFVVGGLKGGVNKIIDAWNVLIRGANKVKISVPKWVPKIGGKGFSLNIPTIPKLAEGGIVTKPTIAQIGERGPEAVIPLSRAGKGLGVTVNINFPARGTVVLGDDMAARKLAQRLTPLVRQALRGQPGFA